MTQQTSEASQMTYGWTHPPYFNMFNYHKECANDDDNRSIARRCALTKSQCIWDADCTKCNIPLELQLMKLTSAVENLNVTLHEMREKDDVQDKHNSLL